MVPSVGQGQGWQPIPDIRLGGTLLRILIGLVSLLLGFEQGNLPLDAPTLCVGFVVGLAFVSTPTRLPTVMVGARHHASLQVGHTQTGPCSSAVRGVGWLCARSHRQPGHEAVCQT